MAIYSSIGLSLRTIEITLISTSKCLVACLASEKSTDKDMTKRLAIRHFGYSKIHDVTTRVNFVFFKEHIGKMCNVKNSWIYKHILLT